VKTQTLKLAALTVRYRQGDAWCDRTLEISGDGSAAEDSVCISGADALIAMRDFLNCLDFSGHRLTLVKPHG
jgi:hypothetical protein